MAARQIIFWLMVLGVAGCSQNGNQRAASAAPAVFTANNPSGYSRLDITRVHDSHGLPAQARLTIDDPRQIAQVAANFPSMGLGRRGPVMILPTADLQFTFFRGDGVRINVISDYTLWSEGVGSWKVHRGFGLLIDALFGG